MASNFCNHWQRSIAAYKAAAKSTNESVQVICEFWRENGAASMDEYGDTLLHFLAIHGNFAAFIALVKEGIVTGEDLRRRNANGDIPLHEAARFGQREVANIMLGIEAELVLELNYAGETPLYAAAASGKKPVFDLLVDYNSDLQTRRHNGCTILHAAVMEEHYSLAISILGSYPELARIRNNDGMMALNVLAMKKSSFRSGSFFVFSDLGRTPFIFLQIFRAFIYWCIPDLYVESTPHGSSKDPYDNANAITKRERSCFTNYLLRNGWFREIDDAKQRHTLALMLMRRLINKEDWSYHVDRDDQDKHSLHPLLQAAKLGINEIVMEILEMYPTAIEILDENGRNIMHIIAEQKNRLLYDYVTKTVVHNDRMLTKVDIHGNTILHAATTLGAPPFVPHAAMYQVAWDVLWFKHIKYDVYPRLWDAHNSEGKTAEELFEEKHLEVRSKAEETIREMANGALILAALIGTVNFAGIFTLPGGFNDKNGKPVLIKNEYPELRLLVIYMGLALISCAFSLGSMYAVVLSKFNTEDFYIALPVKYIIAATATVYAASFTIVACYQAIILEGLLTTKDNGIWIIPPLTALIILILLVFSEVYLPFDYMYLVISRSLSYKSQYV